MSDRYPRDLLMTAAIFGFFAFVWFGWAQEGPPDAAVFSLAVGSVIALVVAVAAGVTAGRHWRTPSALDPHGPGWRRYLTIVGIESTVAAVGAIGLALSPWRALVPAWILLVVGVHFFSLAPVLEMPALKTLGTVLVLGAIAAGALWTGTTLLPSFVAGTVAGVSLLSFAVAAGIRWLRLPAEARARRLA